MVDPNSDDWLPPGWTVEVRVRKNGKRDKYYFAPSSGLKFNSRLEVFRHLGNAQKKDSIQRIANNVVVEKGIAEGLPPGWMKKTRITSKGDTIRRDSYYIDPVSGYAFRSIKDVDRYLQSGEIGRNAFKPKDKDSSYMELEDDKFSSAGVTMKPKLSISMSRSSNLDVIANNQHIPKPACSGEYMSMPASEHISSVVGTELTASVLLQVECSDPKEGQDGLVDIAGAPGCTAEGAQEKQLRESAQTKHGTEKAQNHQRKYKQKKEINLPRRASKRLAGIKIDPVPELKTRNRTRRVAVKKTGEREDIIKNEDNFPKNLPDDATKQFNALEGRSETRCKSESATSTMESPKSGQSKHFYGSDKDRKCFSFLPLENHATVEEHVRVLGNGDEVDAKLDYSFDVPLRELLTDPCIAFAIQTLTGVTFETSKNSQISSEALTTAEGHGKKIERPYMGDDKEVCNVFSSPENFANPEEHGGEAENDDKGNENPVSSSEMALDISWMDPCIKFAIKTLTGTIPLDPAPNPENCLQQQLSSSNTQRHCEMASSSVSLDNMHQTDYLCSQYYGAQKPMFKQQSFVDPTLQHTKNVGIGNSAGARVPHCGEDRRNVCQR